MKEHKLIFVTGNKNKLVEAQDILPWTVVGQDEEIDEVQHHDLEYVATKKAEAAFEKVGQPVFVDDVGVFFPALGGFPGPYAKHFLDAFGNEKIARMVNNEEDKSVLVSCVIAYHDGEKVHTFRGDVNGIVVPTPKGSDGWGFDFIVQPNDYDKTFAEMGSKVKNKISHRSLGLHAFADYLNKIAA
jgi:non-canonical purine NTP pyrophosphatase (RdgB/HAM1 family)